MEHYQKDSDGLVTRLKVPVENKSGKVEYSVDSEDFKMSKSGGFEGYVGSYLYVAEMHGVLGLWHNLSDLHKQPGVHGVRLGICGADRCMSWMRRGMLHIRDGIASTQLRANFSQRIEQNDIATCFPQMKFLAIL